MRQFVEVAAAEIGEKTGNVTLAVPPPFGVGGTATIRKSKGRGGERMNVVVRKIEGNTFYFDVPQDNRIAMFKRPDFSDSPVFVSFQN